MKSLQLRGEYLYAANGSDGLRVYDVANIDNKGRSERIQTAPVSPLGQQAYVHTEDATGVALPTNMPIDPTREQNPANQEQPWNPIYRYAYVSDAVEGLVVVDVTKLGDGNPQNNFLERAAQFNPDGALDGASYITVAGNYAYILCKRGLVVVSIADPLAPQIVSQLGAPAINEGARDRDPVPLRVHHRRRRAQGRRRDLAREAGAEGVAADRGDARHLRRAHLCVRRRRAARASRSST